MDFDFSADQVALRDGARDLLATYASPERVRRHTESGEPYDRELWQAMAAQGWLGIEQAEADGGVGLGAVEAAILAEELGRHAAPAPYVPTILAIDAFARAGTREWVARLMVGDGLACVVWDSSHPVAYAPSADVAVVVDAGGVFAVELDERPAREPAMDVTRELGWLDVGRGQRTALGGRQARQRLLDRGATFASAEMLGGADRALEMSVEYAKTRVQFGRPIGSFQAVKHRCADMLVDVEGMRSTVYWAAWCIGADDPDASIGAAAAKTWCGDASKRVMASALQVHGGIGFTWEHDLHFFLKRSQYEQLVFGDASAHRARLVELLRARVEAGESVV
ncbi:MAG: acyl-CoA dehydrogenase family protein [Actinomycetota bacterium]